MLIIYAAKFKLKLILVVIVPNVIKIQGSNTGAETDEGTYTVNETNTHALL